MSLKLDYLLAETPINEKPVFYLSYPYCSPFQISRHAMSATIKQGWIRRECIRKYVVFAATTLIMSKNRVQLGVQ